MNKQIVPFFDDFFSKNNRLIGFDDFFKGFTTIENQSFPPYNIYKYNVIINDDEKSQHTEKHTFFEIALAGFTKEDISPVFNKKTHELKISGDNSFRYGDDIEFLHKGIANRSFNLSWKLQPNLELVDSKFENGILVIEFKETTDNDSENEIVLSL